MNKVKLYTPGILCPLCPRCDRIVPGLEEFCEICSYDFKKPIGFIRKFFHDLFWTSYKYKYPLYSRPDLREELKALEAIYKLKSKIRRVS